MFVYISLIMCLRCACVGLSALGVDGCVYLNFFRKGKFRAEKGWAKPVTRDVAWERGT